MQQTIIQVAEDFWNIRGSFKIGGVVDIGTHVSLVRLASGSFVFLDAYALSEADRDEVAEIVGEEGEIEAILNLHPFHTVHVKRMHELYPEARLYGTARHHERFGQLPWEPERTEDPELHALYADDFEFTIPAGVDFISANENIHFSSVMALHTSSATVHADDTLMYLRLPLPLRMVGMKDTLGFHPTLARALRKHAGAADEFSDWAEALIEDWGGVKNLCAAHSTLLLDRDNSGAPIEQRLRRALGRCRKRLQAHKRRYG